METGGRVGEEGGEGGGDVGEVVTFMQLGSPHRDGGGDDVRAGPGVWGGWGQRL